MEQQSVTSRTIGNAVFFAEIERLLAEGRSVRIRVYGTSMEPALRNGRTEVELHPYVTDNTPQGASSQLHRGDIILFRYGGGHLLHRIIRTGHRLTTRGDNLWQVYEFPNPTDILAVVRLISTPEKRKIVCTAGWRFRSLFRLALFRPLRRLRRALYRHIPTLRRNQQP